MGAASHLLRRIGPFAAAVSLLLLGDAGAGMGVPGAPFIVIPAPAGHYSFGDAVAAVGDLDGDGSGDIAISTPSHYGGGVVSIVSAADGNLIRTLVGDGDGIGFGYGDDFGKALAVVGDLDGRGKPDLLVGAPGGRTGIPEYSQPTFAAVFAGEDGTMLFSSGPRSPGAKFGAAVSPLGDLDGDEVPEVAVGAPFLMWQIEGGEGYVDVFSGKNGTLVGRMEGAEEGDHLGTSIASLGDVDGDGIHDMAIGSPGSTIRGRKGAGRISIVSGASFEEIRSIDGDREHGFFGESVAALGPSGDDAGIVVAKHMRARPGRDEILFLEAATGRVARRLRVPFERGLGLRLSTIGDQDSDGVREIVLDGRVQSADYPFDGGGFVEVVSGATGRVLFARRGWQGESLAQSHVAAGDLDGDGREDLAVTSGYLEDAEVRIYRMELAEGRRRIRIALQQDAGHPWNESARAWVSLGFSDDDPVMTLFIGEVVERDVAAYLRVHLEDAAGSGTFSLITSTYDQFEAVRWRAPHPLRRAGLAELAGRRFEVRTAAGTVQWRTTIPSPTTLDFRARSELAPPPDASQSSARGSIRVLDDRAEGTTRIDLRLRHLPDAIDRQAWVEDAPGSGTFVVLGPVPGRRLDVDTGRSNPLPGYAADGASLSGRLVEVRDGDVVLLRGTMP